MLDEFALDPRHSALLVLDYQAGVVQSLPAVDVDHLLRRVDTAIGDARSQGAVVAWVRTALDDADFAAIPPHSIMASMATPARRPFLHADSDTTLIDGRLTPQPGELVARKTRIGAFSTSDLDRRLRERGIDTVVLAGIITSGVVLTALREALDLDYRVAVLRDASADRDPELHTFLNERVFPPHATVLNVDELTRSWKPGEADPRS